MEEMHYTKKELEGIEIQKKAIGYVKDLYKDQVDLTGRECKHHLNELHMLMLELVPKETDTLCAAILHDTLEDSATTYEYLKEEFNERIADLVKEVTSNKPHSREGVMIKLADTLCELNKSTEWTNLEMREEFIKGFTFGEGY